MEMTTEVKLPDNKELIDYLEAYVVTYNHIWRRVYEDFINGVFKKEYDGDFNEYINMLHTHYKISTKTAYSIVREVDDTINTLLASKKIELAQLKKEVEKIQNEVESLSGEVQHLKKRAAKNLLDESELERMRKLKLDLYNKRNYLNTIKQRKTKSAKQVRTGRVPLTFGSEELFSAQFNLEDSEFKDFTDWKKAYFLALNHSIFYIEKIDKEDASQMVELIPEDNKSYKLRLLKDLPYRKKDESEFIEIAGIESEDLKDEAVKESLIGGDKENGELAYRFYKKNKKDWYFQIKIGMNVERYF